MGAKGIRIAEPGDVREGLAEALAFKDDPVVVDAVVDPMRSRCRPTLPSIRSRVLRSVLPGKF